MHWERARQRGGERAQRSAVPQESRPPGAHLRGPAPVRHVTLAEQVAGSGSTYAALEPPSAGAILGPSCFGSSSPMTGRPASSGTRRILAGMLRALCTLRRTCPARLLGSLGRDQGIARPKQQAPARTLRRCEGAAA
jgi:hypothetical protein